MPVDACGCKCMQKSHSFSKSESESIFRSLRFSLLPFVAVYFSHRFQNFFCSLSLSLSFSRSDFFFVSVLFRLCFDCSSISLSSVIFSSPLISESFSFTSLTDNYSFRFVSDHARTTYNRIESTLAVGALDILDHDCTSDKYDER